MMYDVFTSKKWRRKKNESKQMNDENDRDENYCAVCERPLGNGTKFARVRYEERMIALCCPICMEKFEANRKFYALRNEANQAIDNVKRPKP